MEVDLWKHKAMNTKKNTQSKYVWNIRMIPT